MDEIVQKIKSLNLEVNADYDDLTMHIKYVNANMVRLIILVDQCSRTVFLSKIDNITLNIFKNVVEKLTSLKTEACNETILKSHFNRQDSYVENPLENFSIVTFLQIKQKIELANEIVNKNYDNLTTHNKCVQLLVDELAVLIYRFPFNDLIMQIDEVNLNMFQNIIKKSSALIGLIMQEQLKVLQRLLDKLADDFNRYAQYYKNVSEYFSEVISVSNASRSQLLRMNAKMTDLLNKAPHINL